MITTASNRILLPAAFALALVAGPSVASADVAPDTESETANGETANGETANGETAGGETKGGETGDDGKSDDKGCAAARPDTFAGAGVAFGIALFAGLALRRRRPAA